MKENKKMGNKQSLTLFLIYIDLFSIFHEQKYADI